MTTSPNSQSPAVSVVTDLLPNVRRSKILSERRCSEIEAKVSTGDYPTDPQLLAECLVKEDVLTEYQARRILENRPEGLIVGRYLILDRIGSGGMGRVYKAKHLMMGRIVALKILSTRHSTSGTRVARFRREMQMVGMLDHPNIVRAFDADQIGNVLYIVMEYVPGRSLEELLLAKGKLPVADVIWCGSQAALGLDHAHKQGVVHRDVKPSNILLSESRKIKLLDLGLGVFLEREANEDFKTEAGIAVGTMDYLSPEQACMKKVDGRSDIYSLGCAMFHLMSGRLPFDGDSSMERIAVRITGQTTPIAELMAGLPPTVVQVMEKMLARQPEDRFQTAGEAAIALKALVRPKGKGSAAVAPSASAAAAPQPTSAPSPSPAVGPKKAVSTWLQPALLRLGGLRAAASAKLRSASPWLGRLRTEVSRLPGLSPWVLAAMAVVLVVLASGAIYLLWPAGDRPKESPPVARPNPVVPPAESVAEVKPAPPPIINPQPSSESDFASLAGELAEKGQWKEAVAAYGKAIDKNPENLSLTHRIAVSLLKAGDVEAYRQECKELLDELRGTENAGAVDVIRACSLAPDVLTDADWAVSLVQGTVKRDPKAGWRLYILGLTHLRAKQFDQAVRRLDESISVDPMWAASFLNWPVLAMAHLELGHAQEARAWIQKARSWQAVTPSRAVSNGTPPASSPWWDRAEFEILRQEAEALEASAGRQP